jgi:imidazolonepropionase-like amidohydrolase
VIREIVVFLLGLTTALSADTLVLKGGAIWPNPTAAPIRKGSVVIDNGHITAVGAVRTPQGARVLDCSGATILAGFWNSHVHFFERKWENAGQLPAQELERQIEAMITRYGFTSVFDLGSPGDNTRAIRRRIESREVAGPRIRTTGEVIVAPGAVPAPNILRILGDMVTANHEVTNANQAAEAARAILASGADGIKIHLQRPLPEEVIRTVVEEAHRAGKPVFVHPTTSADVLASARAGVDVVAHTTPLSPWPDSVVPTLLERRIAITPTLALWRVALQHDRSSVQDDAVRMAVEQVKAWTGAGGTVLFGTDLGASEYDPTEEYELMSRAGMNFRPILAALTTAPAERFGVSEQLGQIAVGFAGDLAVVEGDPSTDIRALAKVRYTVRDGRIQFPSATGR